MNLATKFAFFKPDILKFRLKKEYSKYCTHKTGFIAPGKSGKKIGFTTIFWKVRESQGKSGKKKLFACLVRESQGNF